MTRRFVQVDVFAEAPLEGNQLAVVLDADGMDDQAMRAFTREMNFSETTFVLPPEAGGTARIRIFTPGMELPFAGHPTLGTGWVLAQERGLDEVILEEGVGLVPVRFQPDGIGYFEHPGAEIQALAASPWQNGGTEPELQPAMVNCGPCLAFVPLGSAEEVDRAESPDTWPSGFDGLYVFAVRGEEAYVRMLGGPTAGIVEDPATGSGAGGLAVYLDRVGRMPDRLTIVQGVKMGRPSRLLVRRGPRGFEVGGRVQKVLEGDLSYWSHSRA